MERYRPTQLQQEVQKEPIDIRLAKFGKKLDVLQIVGGSALLVFPPTAALGLGLVAWQTGEYIVKDKYINWRMKGKQQQLAKAA